MTMMRAKSPKAEPNTVKFVRKMVAVLNCFSRLSPSQSVADVATMTGLPKTTVHRILSTLREVGFVEQDRERERYRLGIRLFELGSVVLAGMVLPREAAPFVERLTHLSGVGSHLCVFDGAQSVTVDHREADGRAVNWITTISASPAYCTGVGKAALAFQSPEIVERIIQSGLRRFTRNTITDPDVLREELAVVRARGYAVDNAEHQPGLRCVAAPIRNAAGEVFAAISVSGPLVRIPDDRIEAMAELVIDTAEKISRRLGYAGTTSGSDPVFGEDRASAISAETEQSPESWNGGSS